MGLSDLASKGKDLLGSENAERISDDILAKGSALADEKTGGTYGEQISQGVAHLDKQVGTE